jgi:hypothetical protein
MVSKKKSSSSIIIAKMTFSTDEYFWLRDVIADAIKRRKASGIAIDNLRKKFNLDKVV